jgi:hypothetical protein
MKFPKTIGGVCDALIRIRTARITLQHQVDGLKSQQAELEQHFVTLCKAQKTDTGRGKNATCSYKVVPIPVVKDWDSKNGLYSYIVANDAFDLLHRRVNSTAWLDRMEAGEKIAAIARESVIKVSINKRGLAA